MVTFRHTDITAEDYLSGSFRHRDQDPEPPHVRIDNRIPRGTARSGKLTCEEFAIYTNIRSHRDDYAPEPDSVRSSFERLGKDRFEKALRGLRRKGWLTVIRHRHRDGTIGWEWVTTRKPEVAWQNHLANPNGDIRHIDHRESEKQQNARSDHSPETREWSNHDNDVTNSDKSLVNAEEKGQPLPPGNGQISTKPDPGFPGTGEPGTGNPGCTKEVQGEKPPPTSPHDDHDDPGRQEESPDRTTQAQNLVRDNVDAETRSKFDAPSGWRLIGRIKDRLDDGHTADVIAQSLREPLGGATNPVGALIARMNKPNLDAYVDSLNAADDTFAAADPPRSAYPRQCGRCTGGAVRWAMETGRGLSDQIRRTPTGEMCPDCHPHHPNVRSNSETDD